MTERLPGQYVVRAIAGLPDFRPGDDLAAAICAAAPWLEDGDIVAVTSKAVSKAEGRLVPTGTAEDARVRARQDAIDSETEAVVAQRGGVRIVRTRQGMTMAAAGVDASNVNADEIALLPVDSDASARRIRAGIREHAGADVAVVVTDTVGRPWRAGLVDISLGSAGIAPLRDLRGSVDTHGHPLAVTALAQVDEIASASELVRGKLGRIAAAVIRGIPWQDGDPAVPGSASLIRPTDEDMFCLGARDVVPAARSARPSLDAADPQRVADALGRLQPSSVVEAGAEGTTVTVRCGDSYELGQFVGQLLVALRAEGLAGTPERAGDTVVVRTSAAAPYEGIRR